MARAVSKPKSKVQSRRSRAARRETSPSINVDKSLKEVEAPEDDDVRPEVLKARHGGISKKATKAKQLSSKRKKRLLLGQSRAETVSDRLDKKLEKSLRKGVIIDDRRKDWSTVQSKLEKESTHTKQRVPAKPQLEKTQDQPVLFREDIDVE